MKTQNISAATMRDALSVSGGLYRMNARSSRGYAFTVNNNNTEVNCGEFIFTGEEVTKDMFDGFISFDDQTVTDLESGEVISC